MAMGITHPVPMTILYCEGAVREHMHLRHRQFPKRVLSRLITDIIKSTAKKSSVRAQVLRMKKHTQQVQQQLHLTSDFFVDFLSMSQSGINS